MPLIINPKLGTLSTDAAGKLNILGHDSHTLGMDSTQVGVFKESNKVGFRGLLKSQHSSGLEAEIRLEVLGNLTNKALEGGLADEQVGGLLVLADLTESHSTRAVAVGLLHSSSSGGRLPGSLDNNKMRMARHRRRKAYTVRDNFHCRVCVTVLRKVLSILTLVASC